MTDKFVEAVAALEPSERQMMVKYYDEVLLAEVSEVEKEVSLLCLSWMLDRMVEENARENRRRKRMVYFREKTEDAMEEEKRDWCSR